MSDKAVTGAPAGPSKILLAAIEKLLRPLVRLLLAHQITYPLLSNMLKGIYVDVAEQDFRVNGKRQSDSRVNLLTGVHRKDVKRLRSEARAERSIPSNVSVGARVIGVWLGSADYLDKEGKPLPLPLKTDSSSAPSFESLVEKVCKQDIRPRVILDEWLRLGVATLDQDNQVVLNSGAFTPEKGFDEKVFFFGKNIQDHLSASTHNLLGNTPSYFDRSVYYDGLSNESVQELAKLANSLGMRALTEMNKQALDRQNQDKESPNANYRMNFGIFNFNVETRDTETRGQKG